MYTSTTRNIYKDIMLSRGRKQARLARVKRLLPSIYEFGITIILAITLVGYFTS